MLSTSDTLHRPAGLTKLATALAVLLAASACSKKEEAAAPAQNTDNTAADPRQPVPRR